MPSILNKTELATTPQRKQILDILQAGLDAIDTEKILKEQVVLNGDTLAIQGKEYNLAAYKNLYVLGFGKASAKAAEGIESILGDRISDGVVISITEAKCEKIKVVKGTHPLPSATNVAASKELIKIAERANENDLVICLVSGGGSALLCGTDQECEQGTRLYKEFLKSNGEITELNTVRKHISILKGGGLAEMLYPATVAGLIFSDIAGENYEFITSGPTYKDTTTTADAQHIIDLYNLGHFTLNETPKGDKYFERVNNFVVVSNAVALEKMKEFAEGLGLQAKVLTSAYYRQAEGALHDFENSCKPGEIVFAGGEMRVTITKTGGTGGRCHYWGMVALPHLKQGETCCSFASDGLDNSDSAGIIFDYETLQRAQQMGLDIQDYLSRYDGYGLFKALGKEQIFTGITENNVADWMMLLRG